MHKEQKRSTFYIQYLNPQITTTDAIKINLLDPLFRSLSPGITCLPHACAYYSKQQNTKINKYVMYCPYTWIAIWTGRRANVVPMYFSYGYMQLLPRTDREVTILRLPPSTAGSLSATAINRTCITSNLLLSRTHEKMSAHTWMSGIMILETIRHPLFAKYSS